MVLMKQRIPNRESDPMNRAAFASTLWQSLRHSRHRVPILFCTVGFAVFPLEKLSPISVICLLGSLLAAIVFKSTSPDTQTVRVKVVNRFDHRGSFGWDGRRPPFSRFGRPPSPY
jgi:hypothetical protein